MTTPMHDFLLSSKAVASVLILKKSIGGAFHLGRGMDWDNIGQEQAALNSAKTPPAIS